MEQHQRDVLRRTSAMFTFVMIAAGSLNVLPQVYLLTRYPSQRSALLSGLLLAGTVSAALGIWASRWLLRTRGGLTQRWMWIGTAANVAIFLLIIFEVTPLWLYVGAYCVSRCMSNGLFNHLDQALVTKAGQEGARRHVLGNVVFQLLGTIVGPAAFAFLAAWPSITSTAMVVLGVAAISVVLDGLPKTSKPEAPKPSTAKSSAESSYRVWIFYVFTALCLGSVYGFGAQMIFLMDEHMGVTSAAKWGGALLAVVSSFAAMAVIGSARSKRTSSPTQMLLLCTVPIAATMGLMAFQPPLWLLIVASCGAGAAYGLMLTTTRQIASTWQGAPGRESVLSTYNNMGNLSSLAAYGAIGALAWTMGDTHVWFSEVLLGLLTTGMLIAIALAFPLGTTLRLAGQQPESNGS